MIATIAAAIIVAFQVYYLGTPFEAAFEYSALGLSIWFGVWTVILIGLKGAYFYGFIAGSTMSSGVATSRVINSSAGGVLGAIGGLWFAIKRHGAAFTKLILVRALFVIGALYLYFAGSKDIPFAEFNKVFLLIGGVLILLPHILFHKRTIKAKDVPINEQEESI